MPKKLTTEEFIKKAKAVYDDRYDYSETHYIGTDKLVDIICPIHGKFSVRPHNFLHGHGCAVCSNRERITTKVFIDRSTKMHNGRYDYSLVNCKGRDSYVDIICPVHGVFSQKADYHMNGNGCPKCFGTPKSNTQEFIKKARKIYGDKYDYSKADYQGNKIKLIITCREHGDWLVSPNAFLRGSECPKCYGTPKHTTEEFIELARKTHGDKYDYSRVKYDGLHRKVKIICPQHGLFEQYANSHINGSGCPECSGLFKKQVAAENKERKKKEKEGQQIVNRYERIKFNKIKFLESSKKNHSIPYDYSNVDFVNRDDKVCIVCPTHGEFWQRAYYHSKGGNCPKCAGSYKLTTEEFIKKSKEVHGDKYDYSKVIYKNYNTKVCIICPTHGEFWQVPNNHLYGAGCPACPQSNLEGEMRDFLIRHKIEFEQEKSFPWLRLKRKLFIDFYLPRYKVAIECQGGQHFRPIQMFGGEDYYYKTLERDKIKYDLCKEHGITLLYFSNAKTDYPYPVIETYKELLNTIKHE